MLAIATTAARRLLNFALPPRCLGCGAEIEVQGAFCSSCWASLRFMGEGEGCIQCGLPIEGTGIIGELRCGGCLLRPPAFSRSRSAFLYEGAIRPAILALKHRDRPEYAASLMRHMAWAGALLWEEPDTVFVPVPLHRGRLWRRGYNQAALLAVALANHVGRSCVRDALVRTRATPSQQGMSRTERQRNLRNAVTVSPRRVGRITGRPVVLVDDVLTTGATADCAAAVLLAAGARDVRVVTLARVVAGQSANHIGGVTM